MDNVHVKEDFVYDKHQGKLIGFFNQGEMNSHLLDFESAMVRTRTEWPLANSMLVMMVRGLFLQVNFPYARELLMDPVWEPISRLERQILALTCHGASTNRHMWKMHSEEEGIVHKVTTRDSPLPFFIRIHLIC